MTETEEPRQPQIVAFGGSDLRAVLPGHGARKSNHSTPARAAPEEFAIRLVDSTDWNDTAKRVTTLGDRVDAVVASVSSEFHRPETEWANDLERVMTSCAEIGAILLLINGSSLTGRETSEATALSRRIASLNLLAIEASKRTGLSIVDVDRLVAEIGGHGRVAGPFTYDATVNELVHDEINRVLGDREIVAQPEIWTIRLPPMPQVSELKLREWQKLEGEAFAKGETICTLVVTGLRKLDRATSARDLAVIDQSPHWWRARLSRQRVRHRTVAIEATLSAWNAGTLHRADVHAGDFLRVDSNLGLVTSSQDTHVPRDVDISSLATFRAYLSSADDAQEGA